MNNKFTHLVTLVITIIFSLILSGCNGGGSQNSFSAYSKQVSLAQASNRTALLVNANSSISPIEIYGIYVPVGTWNGTIVKYRDCDASSCSFNSVNTKNLTLNEAQFSNVEVFTIWTNSGDNVGGNGQLLYANHPDSTKWWRPSASSGNSYISSGGYSMADYNYYDSADFSISSEFSVPPCDNPGMLGISSTLFGVGQSCWSNFSIQNIGNIGGNLQMTFASADYYSSTGGYVNFGNLHFNMNVTPATAPNIAIIPEQSSINLQQGNAATANSTTFDFTNQSSYPLHIDNLAAPAGFVKDSDGCGTLLAANSTCRVSGHVLPVNTIGTTQIVYSMTGHDDYGHSQTYQSQPLTVNVSKASPPLVTTALNNSNRVVLSFQSQSPTAGLQFTFTNTSAGNITITGLAGGDYIYPDYSKTIAANLTLDSNGCAGATLAQNQSCTISAHFFGNVIGSGYSNCVLSYLDQYGNSWSSNSINAKWTVDPNTTKPVIYQSPYFVVTDIESQGWAGSNSLTGVAIGSTGYKGYTLYNISGTDIDASKLNYTVAPNLASSELAIDYSQTKTPCTVQLSNGGLGGAMQGTIKSNTKQCDIIFKYTPTAASEAGTVSWASSFPDMVKQYTKLMLQKAGAKLHNAYNDTVNTISSMSYSAKASLHIHLIGGAYGGQFWSSDDQHWYMSQVPGVDHRQCVNGPSGHTLCVGAFGSAIYTSDESGLNWTSANTNQTESLNAVAVDINHSTYVAVGDNGIILAMNDATPNTWMKGNSGTSGRLTSVAFGLGHFVAVSPDSSSLWLSQGSGTSMTWNVITAANPFSAITFDGSQFIAVGANGQVATSADGTTWSTGKAWMDSAATIPVTKNLVSVGYNNGAYAAISSDGVSLASADGKTWFYRSTLPQTLNSIAPVFTSGQTGFIVSGLNYVAFTTDLQHFVPLFAPNGYNMFSAILSPDQSTMIYVGNSGRIIRDVLINGMFSTEPHVLFPYQINQSVNAYAYDGNATVVGVGNGGMIETSSDGKSWNYVESVGTTAFMKQVLYVNGQFVAVGNGQALTSANGHNWNIHSLPAGHVYFDEDSDNNVIVGIGKLGDPYTSTKPAISYSSDNGVSWNDVSSQFGGATDLRAIAHGSSGFVTIDSGSRIYTSPDGKTWSGPMATAMPTVNGMVYGNGTYVAASTGAIYTSADMKNWSKCSGSDLSNYTFYGVDQVGTNSEFIAVGTLGTIVDVKMNGTAATCTLQQTNSSVQLFNYQYIN